MAQFQIENLVPVKITIMSTKLIVTMLTRSQKKYTVCALYQDNRLLEVTAQPEEENSILGNIYVGRVKDVVPS